MSDNLSCCGFTAETHIPLLDGRDLSISDLLQEFGTSQSFWIYSCTPQGSICPRLAKFISERPVQIQALKITLDSGDSFMCSEDQELMRRDGTYVKAKDVKALDSLMPLYRKVNVKGDMIGYEMILSQRYHKWAYTHRVFANKEGGYKGKVIHHINFNKRDNRPDNLQIMSWEEHTKLHNEQHVLLNAYATSPEGRAKSREIMSQNWANKEWREKRFRLNTPEANKKRLAVWKERYSSDEEFAQKVAERGSQNLADYRQRRARGEIQPTEKQKRTWRQNGQRLTWARCYKDKYPTFEEYLESLDDRKVIQHTFDGFLQPPDEKPNNHKVSQTEHVGIRDVHALVVENDDSFALLVGVFVQ